MSGGNGSVSAVVAGPGQNDSSVAGAQVALNLKGDSGAGAFLKLGFSGASLEGSGESARRRFYCDNFVDLMGAALST